MRAARPTETGTRQTRSRPARCRANAKKPPAGPRDPVRRMVSVRRVVHSGQAWPGPDRWLQSVHVKSGPLWSELL